MKKEIYKELEIENVEISNYKMSYKVNIKNFLKKTIIQDLKVLLLCEYNDDNKLVFRQEIKVLDKIPSDCKKVIIKISSKREIGIAEVIDEYHIKPLEIFIENEHTDKIEDLFKTIENHDVEKYKCLTKNNINIWEKNNCKGKEKLKEIKYNSSDKHSIKEKYLSGLFKIYYDSLVYSSIINSIERIEGKANAMASYIAIKNNLDKYLKEKKIAISNPNVFIKDINMEFDALIVNKDSKEKFFFDNDEVNSLIEIKSSGLFLSKDNLIDNGFIKYITSHEKKQQELRKKYIYFSLYESYGQRDSSIHYYEFLLANLSTLDKNKYIGVFCALKKDQNHYLIPYEYDLEKILKRILEK